MNELIKLESRKKNIGYEIRQAQRSEHNRLYSSHKAMFRLMDIAVVLLILMNFGAVALTNALVVKKYPKLVEILSEANVVQAKMNDYEVHPNAMPLLKAFIRQAMIWAFILFSYIYYRSRIWTELQLGVMVSIVCFYFIICGRDFFNDFGYYIGKLMFGG